MSDAHAIDEELRQRCRDRLSLVDHRRRLQQQLHRALSESYEAILAVGLRLTSPFVPALLRDDITYDEKRHQDALRRAGGRSATKADADLERAA